MGFQERFKQYNGGRYLLYAFILATVLGVALGLINAVVVPSGSIVESGANSPDCALWRLTGPPWRCHRLFPATRSFGGDEWR